MTPDRLACGRCGSEFDCSLERGRMLVRQGDLSGTDALAATGGTRARWGESRLRELIPLDLEGQSNGWRMVS